MRKVLALLLLTAVPAAAQVNYYNPQAKNTFVKGNITVVTSLQKCYDALDREDAVKIQNSSLTPWRDCQLKLAEKLQQAQKKDALK